MPVSRALAWPLYELPEDSAAGKVATRLRNLRSHQSSKKLDLIMKGMVIINM